MDGSVGTDAEMDHLPEILHIMNKISELIDESFPNASVVASLGIHINQHNRLPTLIGIVYSALSLLIGCGLCRVGDDTLWFQLLIQVSSSKDMSIGYLIPQHHLIDIISFFPLNELSAQLVRFDNFKS